MRITLAAPWTDTDGKAHAPDKSVTVDDPTGAALIRDGLARPADPPAKKQSARKTTPKAARKAPARTQPATRPPGATSEKE